MEHLEEHCHDQAVETPFGKKMQSLICPLILVPLAMAAQTRMAERAPSHLPARREEVVVTVISSVSNVPQIGDHYYAVDLDKVDKAQDFLFPDPRQTDGLKTPAKNLTVEFGTPEIGWVRYELDRDGLVWQTWMRSGGRFS